MSGFGQEVQAAMFSRLTASPLPGGIRVFTVVPDEVKPPAVVIAESDASPVPTKTGAAAEQHVVTVRTFMVGTSKAPMLAVMRAVVEALDGQALTSPAGVALSSPRWLASDELRDVDSAYLIGSQSFLVMACPS